MPNHFQFSKHYLYYNLLHIYKNKEATGDHLISNRGYKKDCVS